MIASRTEAEEIRERGWGNVAVQIYKIELRETIRREMFPRLESTYPKDNMSPRRSATGARSLGNEQG